jgi:3-methyladenine DNA glycosylase AlkC
MRGLGALELTGRAAWIAENLQRHLPEGFAAAVEIILRSLGPLSGDDEPGGMAPFAYLPYLAFVARYGLDHFETSMRAQYELTQRFSAEFSIRAFLVKHPDATYQRLRQWAGDANVHVRRLVSEGTRPRLPWAPRLRAFQADPAPVLRLLELLKDDPERYVQRSVANSLNDIGKDHPALVVAVCRRWSQDAPAGSARSWIVGHALRSLIKRGDRSALAILGHASVPKIAIAPATFAPRRVKLGGKIRFSFELVSKSAQSQDLLVDFAVHFRKANGSSAPKVFKLRKIRLDPRARVPLSALVSFIPMTTRKPQPGQHRIEALVNGVVFPLGEFQVVG